MLSRHLSKTGKFRFVLVGRSVNKDLARAAPLIGRIFVFFTHDVWKEGRPDETSAEALIRYGQNDLQNFDPESDVPLADYFLKKYEDLTAKLSKLASCYADFDLSRQGEFSLGKISEGQTLADTVFPRPEHARKMHLLKLANEVYFFAKDITHRHQHHDPRSDTTLTIFEHSGTDEWVINTFRSLRFHVIAEKRECNEAGYSDALGFLAYKRVFAEMMNTRIKHLIGDGELDSDQNAELSINAKLEQIRIENGRRAGSRQYILATLLGFVGVLLNWGQIVSGKTFPPESPLGILQNILINDAPAAFGTILAIVTVVWIVAFRKSLLFSRAYGAIYKMLAGLSENYVIAIVVAILLGLMIAFVWVLLAF